VVDYALVLNAGSSSLKFCVFMRPGEKDWQVAAPWKCRTSRRAALPPDGTSQVEELKLNYTLNDFQPPRIEAIKKACEQFRAEGLKAF
jgi:acetate kinase